MVGTQIKEIIIVWVVAQFGRPSVAEGLSSGERSACSCDCCQVEVQREEPHNGEDHFQCAFAQSGLIFTSPFRAQQLHCEPLCRHSGHDEVLQSAVAADVDTERFCFFECEPTNHSGAESFKKGDLCQALTRKEALAVQDESGNALPPMEQAQVMPHFLAHRARRARTVVVGQGSAPAPAPAPGPAPGPAGAAIKFTWDAIQAASMTQSARIVGWAQEATKAATKAKDAEDEVEKLASKAEGGISSAFAAVEAAKTAAREAQRSEMEIRKVLREARQQAHDVAFSMLPGIERKMEMEAHKQIEYVAAKDADVAEQNQKLQALTAAKAAMAPYKQAMDRAAGVAADFTASGNELNAQAAQEVLKSKELHDRANQLIVRGQTPNAQRQIAESFKAMQHAKELTTEANKMFEQSRRITESLGGYSAQAMQAAYHAEAMINPDAVPAMPPPLGL